MCGTIVKTCDMYNSYLSNLPELMKFKGDGFYKGSDDAIVLVKNCKLKGEIKLANGELIGQVNRDNGKVATKSLKATPENLTSLVRKFIKHAKDA